MSEVTNIVKQEQQQQEYVGGSSNLELRCKDCNVFFNSDKSLEVHLQYHKENLLSQWSSHAQQQESNNNNNKAGNHNRQVSVNQNNVTTSADLREPSSIQDPISSQQHQQQQQQSQPQPADRAYNHFFTPISFPSETDYLLPNMSHIPMDTCPPFPPPHEDIQNNGISTVGYSRYHPYQSFSSEGGPANSTSPQITLQCEKCGIIYEEATQLGEHIRGHHSNSPSVYPSASRYQQLSNSPQHQNQQQQLHTSSPHSNQSQQQSNYDYNGGESDKLELKQEPEEQREILDLDSHKVQRYEEILRLQQQQQHQQHGLHIQMHQQAIIHQQPRHHPVNPMLSWTSHDYSGLPPMNPMESIPPNPQGPFIRGQHIPVETHQATSIIANAQQIPGHQMPTNLLQPSKQSTNQTWKSNEARRPKTYNCTACNKWFTSSGHLKRHYNTTLHKNAVKQSNLPDPANLPISAHHHPGRENNVGHSTSSRSNGPPERSSDVTSSGSPPNSMAGPSGEATGGLLHAPNTLYNINCNSNSSNSNDSPVTATLAQQQQHQGPPSAAHMGSGMLPLNPTQQPSMVGHHHQQQMGSPSHQVGLQQPQQPLHHLPMSSPGQIHHSMSSPMHLQSHLNSSQMGSSSHPHHMNSVHSAMVSPTVVGTTMPHQPYPNAPPPHVSNTTNMGLLEPTNLHTIGSDENQQQRQNHDDVLPSFGTFSNNHQKVLSNFTQIGPEFFNSNPDQMKIMNVGGPFPEKKSPQPYNSESYEFYQPPRYNLLDMDAAMIQANAETLIKQEYDIQDQIVSARYQQSEIEFENNNNTLIKVKEEFNTSIESNSPSDSSPNDRTAVLTEQRMAKNNGAINEDNSSPLRCYECGKNFNGPCYLTQHNKSFHCGDKPYKCTQCGKRFSKDAQYQTHKQKHEGEKPYKCVTCPKQFNHKTDLRRHTCLHTGTKPFKCSICLKGFIRKDHMMKHHDTHKKKSNARHQKENVRTKTQSHQNPKGVSSGL